VQFAIIPLQRCFNRSFFSSTGRLFMAGPPATQGAVATVGGGAAATVATAGGPPESDGEVDCTLTPQLALLQMKPRWDWVFALFA
jgi:hypothetical protein